MVAISVVLRVLSSALVVELLRRCEKSTARLCFAEGFMAIGGLLGNMELAKEARDMDR